MSLKAKLRSNAVTIGSWITLAHPAIAEIMADAGFDWLAIDLEHSVITIREAEELIRIVGLKGVTPLVRLTTNDPNQAKRLMDAGAGGVIVPMVNSRSDAESAVRAVRYPPLGNRGVGLARAQGYGFSFETYLRSQDDVVVIAQVEHIDSIRNLEAILAVEGIDGTMIGPYDLSGSLGKPGAFSEPKVTEALKTYEDVSRRLNKPLGFHVIQPDHAAARLKIKNGYSFVAFGVDFLFLGNGCRSQMAALRAGVGDPA